MKAHEVTITADCQPCVNGGLKVSVTGPVTETGEMLDTLLQTIREIEKNPAAMEAAQAAHAWRVDYGNKLREK